MALDFCIKNNHGIVIHKISITIEEFYGIIEIAHSFNPPLLLIGRLKDYYKDEEFYISELSQLKTELLEVYKKSTGKLKIILKLELLCEMAILDNTTICVIAD